MKAISINDSVQVAGGAGLCLFSIANVALGTTTCLATLSEDMSSIQIPLASVMPYVLAASLIVKGASELMNSYNDYRLTSNVVAPKVSLAS
jgi:hypothetical protein